MMLLMNPKSNRRCFKKGGKVNETDKISSMGHDRQADAVL